MYLTLTWDLFIAFFFAVVTAYSFIIGKHDTLKILIAIYIAILATQGVGNILIRFAGGSDPVSRVLLLAGINLTVDTVSSIKLGFFMMAVVLIALKGGFTVDAGESHSSIIAMAGMLLFGVATAGIVILALVTFISGLPLMDPGIATHPTVQPLMSASRLIQLLVLNQELWFSLPALLLVGFGLMEGGEEE